MPQINFYDAFGNFVKAYDSTHVETIPDLKGWEQGIKAALKEDRPLSFMIVWFLVQSPESPYQRSFIDAVQKHAESALRVKIEEWKARLEKYNDTDKNMPKLMTSILKEAQSFNNGCTKENLLKHLDRRFPLKAAYFAQYLNFTVPKPLLYASVPILFRGTSGIEFGSKKRKASEFIAQQVSFKYSKDESAARMPPPPARSPTKRAR